MILFWCFFFFKIPFTLSQILKFCHFDSAMCSWILWTTDFVLALFRWLNNQQPYNECLALLIFFIPAGWSNFSLAFYFFQSDDKSSYKSKYFTLMSAMKQLQNTFLRAQKNTERNIKGTSTTKNVLSYYVVHIFNSSPVFTLLTICHIVQHSWESGSLSFKSIKSVVWRREAQN